MKDNLIAHPLICYMQMLDSEKKINSYLNAKTYSINDVEITAN